ncbi:MAG: phosphoheptose isomerase [Zoogloeaceae bacterium]|jgi:D-sedoheptulose 7-phosphate isomerase|nr:phosphoheptose isomerase [Zoogloeaceae bacterium]
MGVTGRIAQQFTESAAVKEAAREALAAPLATACELLSQTLLSGGRILACGNGGSAADAQHFAAELVGRFERERRELAAIALTTDSSILTAIGNDYGFHEVFARQVRALGNAGDLLLAISTSGNSANILAATAAAHAKKMRVIAMTGNGGGKIGATLTENDIHLCVPASRTARIQETHLLMIHCLCDGIDELLPGG